MGKINVSLLRYLNTEDYRVLTAVSLKFAFCYDQNILIFIDVENLTG